MACWSPRERSAPSPRRAIPRANDSTPPTLTGVQSSAVTASTATFAWTTNEAADTQVRYGTTTSYGRFSSFDSNLTTTHAVTLAGLQPNTTYHYQAMSRD